MLERFLSCEAVKYNVLQEDVVYLMERLDQTLETAPSPQEERLVSVGDGPPCQPARLRLIMPP